MRRVEGPADEDRAADLPAAGQVLLPAGEPPAEPAKHTRMGERGGPAIDPHPHPADRRPQYPGLGHDERDRPGEPVAHHAHLRHRLVLGERLLHGRRRQLHARRQHERVPQAASEPDMARLVEFREVARLEPVGIGAGTRRIRRSGDRLRR